MSVSDLKEKIGDFAKDVRLNLSKVLSAEGAPGLNDSQIFGTALACAYATRDKELAQAIIDEAGEKLDARHIEAAKAATSIMAMNNVYYRFSHLSEDKEFGAMPAALRMQILANHGIDKVEFELYALGVSAINGCGMCMDSHVKAVMHGGLSKQGAQSAVRIASVINSVAQALFFAK